MSQAIFHFSERTLFYSVSNILITSFDLFCLGFFFRAGVFFLSPGSVHIKYILDRYKMGHSGMTLVSERKANVLYAISNLRQHRVAYDDYAKAIDMYQWNRLYAKQRGFRDFTFRQLQTEQYAVTVVSSQIPFKWYEQMLLHAKSTRGSYVSVLPRVSSSSIQVYLRNSIKTNSPDPRGVVYPTIDKLSTSRPASSKLCILARWIVNCFKLFLIASLTVNHNVR